MICWLMIFFFFFFSLILVKSFIALHKECFQEEGVTYIPSEKLLQDPLE